MIAALDETFRKDVRLDSLALFPLEDGVNNFEGNILLDFSGTGLYGSILGLIRIFVFDNIDFLLIPLHCNYLIKCQAILDSVPLDSLRKIRGRFISLEQCAYLYANRGEAQSLKDGALFSENYQVL